MVMMHAFFVSLACGMAGWPLCVHREKDTFGKVCSFSESLFCPFNALISAPLYEPVRSALQDDIHSFQLCLKVYWVTCVF